MKKLNLYQKQIITLIQEFGTITGEKLARTLEISPAKVRVHIANIRRNFVDLKLGFWIVATENGYSISNLNTKTKMEILHYYDKTKKRYDGLKKEINALEFILKDELRLRKWREINN